MADLNGEKSTGGNLNGVLSPVHPVYKIDETLTKGGYAADAKATGDALAGKAPASHVTDKNNPHGVTIAKIGAAPAGYGYGEIPVSLGSTSDDAAFLVKLNEQFDLTSGKTRLVTFSMGGVTYIGTLFNAGNGYGTLTANSYTDADTGALLTKIVRNRFNGNWQPWEYENPPLKNNTEYRTTERFDGKAVYTRLVNCGIAAHNASITIPGVNRCVRYIGYISHPNESYPIKPLPVWSDDTIGTGYHAEVTQHTKPYADGQFIIKTDSNADSFGGGGYTWFVQAWYTKY